MSVSRNWSQVAIWHVSRRAALQPVHMAELFCPQEASLRTGWRPERAEGGASKHHHGELSYLMIWFFNNLSSKSVSSKHKKNAVGVSEERIVLSLFNVLHRTAFAEATLIRVGDASQVPAGCGRAAEVLCDVHNAYLGSCWGSLEIWMRGDFHGLLHTMSWWSRLCCMEACCTCPCCMAGIPDRPVACGDMYWNNLKYIATAFWMILTDVGFVIFIK